MSSSEKHPLCFVLIYLLIIQTTGCLLVMRCNPVIYSDTVDGQNPAPVDMVNIPLFAGFHTSQVVQDFVHQPYEVFFPNVLYHPHKARSSLVTYLHT